MIVFANKLLNYIYIYIYTYIHTHTQKHTYIYIYIYIYTLFYFTQCSFIHSVLSHTVVYLYVYLLFAYWNNIYHLIYVETTSVFALCILEVM